MIISVSQTVRERISRKTDQKVYQPRIQYRRIRELYCVKELTGRPMTVLVDDALALYLSSFAALPQFKEYLARLDAEWSMEEEKTQLDFA